MLSLSLSLSLTHTHSLSLSLSHTISHPLSLSHTHTHSLSLSHSLSLTHTSLALSPRRGLLAAVVAMRRGVVSSTLPAIAHLTPNLLRAAADTLGCAHPPGTPLVHLPGTHQGLKLEPQTRVIDLRNLA